MDLLYRAIQFSFVSDSFSLMYVESAINYLFDNLYPFSVHVVIFNFYYQLMHLLIKNTFTV